MPSLGSSSTGKNPLQWAKPPETALQEQFVQAFSVFIEIMAELGLEAAEAAHQVFTRFREDLFGQFDADGDGSLQRIAAAFELRWPHLGPRRRTLGG